MFPFPQPYLVVAGVLVVLGALGAAGYGGYSYRDARCVADAAEAERQVSDALATLATRDVREAVADVSVRAAVEGAVAQRVEVVRREIVKIPVRIGCGHSDAEYRVLLDTYCARYPAAAQCLYQPVRPADAPAAGTGQPHAD